MKTSNSIHYAVVVLVLGVSLALNAPQAFAAVERVHPATMCVKSTGGVNITRGAGGTIRNASTVGDLFVTCDVVNEVDLTVAGNHPRIISGTISTTDRHPTRGITCQLIQAVRSFLNSNIIASVLTKQTQGASNNLNFMAYGDPDPNNLTGLRSNNYYQCSIPPSVNGAASELHFYSVVEE